jgi:DNA-binding PadR family transcriptional regulator
MTTKFDHHGNCSDENWATLEELLREYHHPEHGNAPIDLATLTDKLRRLTEMGLMEIAWDDHSNEPIFRLTDEAHEKYLRR